MIGMVSPEGKFYECESWGHRDLAQEIVKDEYPDFENANYGSDCEDCLLLIGFIVLRARDAYRKEWVDGKPRPMTDAQIAFLSTACTDLTWGQGLDISKMLLDDEQGRRILEKMQIDRWRVLGK